MAPDSDSGDRSPIIIRKESITVAFMLDQLRSAVDVSIETLNETDIESQSITESYLHRPGLALTGFLDLFTYQRVQILGNTEVRYLAHLADPSRAFQNLIQFPLPCIVLTENNVLDLTLVDAATEAGIPVLRTPIPTTEFMARLRNFLLDQFAPQRSLHGSLVDVYGVGMLLTGKSGIGKSEVALDLVERGHRLVADDVVIITQMDNQVLMGSGTKLGQHFMEVRGLGLLDVRSMFGVRAIRYQKRIEVVVRMQWWDKNQDYVRLGLAHEVQKIMEVEISRVNVPVTPGKSISVICEVIALNQLLRHYGYDPSDEFAKRLKRQLRRPRPSAATRNIEYFGHDYE